jgi:hypothetical protein
VPELFRHSDLRSGHDDRSELRPGARPAATDLFAQHRPVVSSEFAITRCAVTNEKDVDKERTIGRKFNVPYGLYRCHGFINATLAEKTGFTEDDLALLKKALNSDVRDRPLRRARADGPGALHRLPPRSPNAATRAPTSCSRQVTAKLRPRSRSRAVPRARAPIMPSSSEASFPRALR